MLPHILLETSFMLILQSCCPCRDFFLNPRASRMVAGVVGVAVGVEEEAVHVVVVAVVGFVGEVDPVEEEVVHEVVAVVVVGLGAEEDIDDHTLVINYMAYSDSQFLPVVVVENLNAMVVNFIIHSKVTK